MKKIMFLAISIFFCITCILYFEGSKNVSAYIPEYIPAYNDNIYQYDYLVPTGMEIFNREYITNSNDQYVYILYFNKNETTSTTCLSKSFKTRFVYNPAVVPTISVTINRAIETEDSYSKSGDITTEGEASAGVGGTFSFTFGNGYTLLSSNSSAIGHTYTLSPDKNSPGEYAFYDYYLTTRLYCLKIDIKNGILCTTFEDGFTIASQVFFKLCSIPTRSIITC